MSAFHHGRFDMPRGALVPRDKDADDDDLAVFKGQAVPLSAFVWLPTTVDEAEATVEQFTTSVR